MKRNLILNVKNKRSHVAEAGQVDVYCGRGSVLGNPYSHKEGTKAKFVVESRDEAVDAYREYFAKQMVSDDAFVKEMRRIYKIALRSEVNLICYCAPLRCHCSVIRAFILSF